MSVNRNGGSKSRISVVASAASVTEATAVVGTGRQGVFTCSRPDFQKCALLRADFCERIVAPLPCLAQQWAATSSGPASACRTGRLTHGAARNHVRAALHVQPRGVSGRAMRDAGS
jgi:hypothetical protein